MRRLLYGLLGLFVVIFVFSLFLGNKRQSQINPKPEIIIDKQTSNKSSNQNNENTENNNQPQTNQENISYAKNTTPTNKTPLKFIVKDGIKYPNHKYETFIVPNDPSYNQWWVSSNGMQTVWDIPAEPTQVVVAVIDTGFALGHEEFTDRFYQNPGEKGATTSEQASNLNCTDQSIALDKSCNNIDDDFDQIVDNETGSTTEENPSKLNCTDQSIALDKSCNNIDDDLNGFIDDISGWDFSNYDASPQAGEINPSGIGTTHGTMVAGILGANGNNSVGIAGANWHAKIMPIQALDDNRYGDSFTVGQSIYYAVDNGADIVSISLGTSFNDPYMRAAILYALEQNVLVVAAAGNTSCSCMSFPANYPEVIAVGAVNSTGSLASFSSYGPNLDILAPGQTMSSPTYSSSNKTSSYASNIAGTSFATPFTSGILAYGKMLHPDAAWEEIIGVMFENSDRKTNTLSSPHSNSLGYGVVKADSMTTRLRSPQTFKQRVQFDDLNLGSKRNYQCEAGQIPASRFYELKKSGQVKYTANLSELSKSTQTGWTSKQLGYVCSGLAFDVIEDLRVLNLNLEINNSLIKG